MNRYLAVLFLASLAFYAVFFWTEPMYPGAVEPYNLNRLQAFYNIILLPEQIWESFHGLSPEEQEYSTILGYAGDRAAQEAYLNAQNTSVLPISRLSVLLIAGILSVWIVALGRLLLRIVARKGFRLQKIIGFDAESAENADSAENNDSRQAGRLLYLGFSFLLGAAFLGALVGCLGLLGHVTNINFYSSWIFWPLLVITVISSVSPAAVRENGSCFVQFIKESFQRNVVIPRVAFALSALFLIYAAMLPPLEFDVREYHLQAAKEFYQLGSLKFLAHNVYANMPLGLESLSLVSMCLAGDWFLGALAGKVVIVLFALIIVLILGAAGERLTGSWTPGTLAGLIFLSIPLVWEASTFGLVDVALGAYCLAAVYLILAWEHFHININASENNLSKNSLTEPQKKNLDLDQGAELALPESRSDLLRLFFLVGLLTGGAVAIKYTAVVFLAIPFLVWIAFRTRSTDVRTRIRVLTMYLAGILLIGGVWYAKNSLLIGNPVYPLAQNVFGNVIGNGLTTDSLERWNRVHSPSTVTNAELVRLGARFSWQAWGLGTLFIPSLIGLILFWPQLPRWARHSTLFVGVYLILWFFLTHRITRFLLPIFPVVLLSTGWTLWFAREKTLRIGRNLLTFLLATGLLSCFLYQTLIGSGINDFLAPLSATRVHPFRMTIGEDRVLLWLTEAQNGSTYNTERETANLPKITKRTPILLIGDAAVFGWSVPVRYATCFNAEPMLTDWLRDLDPQLAQTVLRLPIDLEAQTGLGAQTIASEPENPSNFKQSQIGAPTELNKPTELDKPNKPADSKPSLRIPGLVIVNWQEIDRYRNSDYGYCPWFSRELIAQLVARGRLTKIPFNTESLPASAENAPSESDSTIKKDLDWVEIFRERFE